jgi:hypothetical protein
MDMGPASKPPPLDMAQTQDLLSQLQANTAGKEDLGKLRNELGSLRFSLQNEVRLLKEQGFNMSPFQREAIDQRIQQGFAQALDLEYRIVANDPVAANALARARWDGAELGKKMDAAQLEKQGLQNDRIPDIRQTGEISSQDATIDKLAKGLEAAAAQQNAALGMTPLVMARIDLVETRKEIDGLRKAMSASSLYPGERTKVMEALDAKARDLENVILAGQPQAQKELASLHDRGSAWEKEGYKLMGAVNEARIKQDPQTIAKLEKELAGVDASLHDLRLATDTLLGTIAPPK